MFQTWSFNILKTPKTALTWCVVYGLDSIYLCLASAAAGGGVVQKDYERLFINDFNRCKATSSRVMPFSMYLWPKNRLTGMPEDRRCHLSGTAKEGLRLDRIDHRPIFEVLHRICRTRQE